MSLTQLTIVRATRRASRGTIWVRRRKERGKTRVARGLLYWFSRGRLAMASLNVGLIGGARMGTRLIYDYNGISYRAFPLASNRAGRGRASKGRI